MAPGDEACDPATFVSACRDGRPALCTPLEGPRAGQARVLFVDQCADGNRCIEAAQFVGCGVGETPCQDGSRARCDGDALVSCEPAFPRVGVGRTGIERRMPCPNGCVTGDMGGGCAPLSP